MLLVFDIPVSDQMHIGTGEDLVVPTPFGKVGEPASLLLDAEDQSGLDVGTKAAIPYFFAIPDGMSVSEAKSNAQRKVQPRIDEWTSAYKARYRWYGREFNLTGE